MGTLRETLQFPFMALLLLPVCICIFTANLKSISCFAESGYNANIYVYLGQFHSRRMALPAFYWPPELCYADCDAVDISPSPFPLALLLCLRLRLRFRHDAKVLPLHATWRMRNIYLCQLSLIAIQCQLRCQFTPLPSPSPPLWHLPSVVFAMFTYVSFPSGLVEHIRPIWRPISALRFSERATNCRWDWQPVQLIRLSVCLSASLLACHLSVCPSACLFVHQSAWCGLPGVSIWIVASSWPSKWKFSLSTLATKLTSTLYPPSFPLRSVLPVRKLCPSPFAISFVDIERISAYLSRFCVCPVCPSVCIDVCLRVRHLLLAFQFATFNSIYFQFINRLQHELVSLLCCIANKVFHCY